MEREIAALTDRLAACTTSLVASKEELPVTTQQLGEKEAENATLTERFLRLHPRSAMLAKSKKALHDTKQEIEEQGLRMSEDTVSFVGQSKIVAQLDDLLRASIERINVRDSTCPCLRLRVLVTLVQNASKENQHQRQQQHEETDGTGLLGRAAAIGLVQEGGGGGPGRRSGVSPAFHGDPPAPGAQGVPGPRSAMSIKTDATPAIPSSNSTGTMSIYPSYTSTGGSSNSSNSARDSTWGSAELFVISPLAPSPAKAEAVQAVQEPSSSRIKYCASGIKGDSTPAASIDGATSTMATTLSRSGDGSGSSGSGSVRTSDSRSDSDSDSVQPVAGASRDLPFPTDVASEATPAVVQTGAHNRPGKRGRGGW